MGATVRNALIVIVLLAAAYTGASWAIGTRAQSTLMQREQQVLTSVPYLRVVARDYQRGIYSSSEQVTYGIGGPLAQSLRLSPGGRQLLAMQLTVHERIEHGPLPGLHAFGLAAVQTELQLPPKLDRELQAALGGRPLLQVRSVLGWLGGGRVEFVSPALRLRAADGTSIDWRGLTGNGSFSRGMQAWSMTLSAPGLSLQSAAREARVGLQLTGLKVSSRGQLAYDTLHLGHVVLTLDRLELQPSGRAAVRLQGISYDSNSTLDGQYIDAATQLHTASVQSAQFTATLLTYAQRLTHVHGPALAGFTQAMRGLQGRSLDATQVRSAMLDAFRRFGTQVALNAPVLEISDAGFRMPEGQLRLSGRVTMPGLQAEDMQGPLPAMSLLSHLQVSADLRADAALVDKLLSGNAGAAVFEAQLGVLEAQGYVRRDGSAYVCHVTYQGGRLAFNGKPYPPQPAAAGP